MRVFALFLIAAVGPSAALADFTGRVVKVSDGDTLTVLVDKTQMRVRLDAIDAPESYGFSTSPAGNMKKWRPRLVPGRAGTASRSPSRGAPCAICR